MVVVVVSSQRLVGGMKRLEVLVASLVVAVVVAVTSFLDETMASVHCAVHSA